jgi:hypothetical protein
MNAEDTARDASEMDEIDELDESDDGKQDLSVAKAWSMTLLCAPLPVLASFVRASFFVSSLSLPCFWYTWSWARIRLQSAALGYCDTDSKTNDILLKDYARGTPPSRLATG